MHMVGVGAAPNRSLATAIARAGRGAEILTTEGEDIERAAKRLVDRTRAPMLTEVTVSGAAVSVCAPRAVPDVYAGAPLLVAMELLPAGGEITVRGTTAGGAWERTVRAPRVETVTEEGAIPALFARERVADLDVTWAMGRETAEIDRQVESIGVDFQIATRLTSFVAIDEERRVDPGAPYRKVSVPQELPHGTTFQGFGLSAAPTPMFAPMPMSLAGPMQSSTSTGMVMDALASMGGAAPARAKQSPVSSGAPLARKRRSRAWFFIALFFALGLVALAVYLFLHLFH